MKLHLLTNLQYKNNLNPSVDAYANNTSVLSKMSTDNLRSGFYLVEGQERQLAPLYIFQG